MAKLLRIRDYLLLSTATVGEIFEDFRLVGDLVPRAMELKYGFVPPNFKRNSYLSSVSKLLSIGDIKRKVDTKGNLYLELTAKGDDKFKRRFPILALQKKKWDGNFMLVIYDIDKKSNKTRDLLRRKLKELGFGMLQESVWVSPHHFEDDFSEFIKSNKLAESVYVLSAKTLLVLDNISLVTKIWKLDDLNNNYQKILNSIAKGVFDSKTLWDNYFAVVIKDPMLPNELLPAGWLQKKVLSALIALQK